MGVILCCLVFIHLPSLTHIINYYPVFHLHPKTTSDSARWEMKRKKTNTNCDLRHIILCSPKLWKPLLNVCINENGYIHSMVLLFISLTSDIFSANKCKDSSWDRDPFSVNRCYQFHLPSVCSMSPPPAGKCCSVPNCPANVNIQFPPDYQANWKTTRLTECLPVIRVADVWHNKIVATLFFFRHLLASV